MPPATSHQPPATSHQPPATSHQLKASHNTQSTNRKKKKGFTLVELAIVLVIIGFLISGVLVGKSLIDTTKVQSIAREIAQYEIAVNNFYSNYKYYPGDAPQFAPPGNGNGDVANNITSGCHTAPYSAYGKYEVAHAFSHLTQARMISEEYVSWSPSECGGSHADFQSDDATSCGVIFPCTEIDSKASYILSGLRGYQIWPIKGSSSTNFYFYFIVNASEAIPLEKKLGAQPGDGTERQIGLTNVSGQNQGAPNSLGLCWDYDNSDGGADSLASCSSPHAEVGLFYYFLSPQ